MERDMKRLNDLVLQDIDPKKVKNPTLKKILGSANRRVSYVFFKPRHHEDEMSVHTDEGDIDRGHHLDRDGGHTDHADHHDYSESSHIDVRYSESHYHTESDAGHQDYSERKHIDY